MPRISIAVNGISYQLTCRDGEEDRLLALAAYLDGKVQDLVGQVGQVGEARLLLMSALMVCDELAEAIDRLEHGKPAEAPAPPDAALPAATEDARLTAECAARLLAAADRIEALAAGGAAH